MRRPARGWAPANVRLHIGRHLGSTQLGRLSAAQMNAWLRQLETSGRADGTGWAIGAHHKVRVHDSTVGVVRRGPGRPSRGKSHGPGEATERRRGSVPEMHAWSAVELRTFLDWTKSIGDEFHPAWQLLGSTGMR